MDWWHGYGGWFRFRETFQGSPSVRDRARVRFKGRGRDIEEKKKWVTYVVLSNLHRDVLEIKPWLLGNFCRFLLKPACHQQMH